MIHRVFSNLASFSELTFRPGLNVLLADRSPGATQRQTRNGAGKTSLIELFHFLLGADCDPDSLFRIPDLVDASFGMDFDIKGQMVRAERSGSQPSKIVVSGDTTAWPISPKVERETGELVISNANWKHVLGNQIFGLPSDPDGSNPYDPSFRSLISYFVRRQNSNGFQEPTKIAGQQQLGDQQVSISFLLGLDWTISQAWQVVRDRERLIRELKRAAKTGALGEVIGTTAQLRTKVTLAEQVAEELRKAVTSFRVLEEYHAFEAEAAQLSRELSELADANTLDRRFVGDLKETIASEVPPPYIDLRRVFDEAGVVLPEKALRRFEDVRNFHESVIENRKSYLEQELEAATRRIAERDRKQQAFDDRRAKAMAILRSHGALEQLTLLQSALTAAEAEVEALRQQFKTAEAIEGQKTAMDIERAQLIARLQQDFHDHAKALKDAIVAFEKISKALYEQPGSLTISHSANGPVFDVQIHAAKSKGINNMQIFCFDLMLSELCAKRNSGPGFLVHDSHLFDGVDERQVAKALELGGSSDDTSVEQYIVTMNSDDLPSTFSDEFDIQRAILPVRLTDATADGGLFGIRFQ